MSSLAEDFNSTSLRHSPSQPIITLGSDHVTKDGEKDINIKSVVLTSLIIFVAIIGIILVMDLYKRAKFRRIVRYVRQITIQLFVLFYVTLVFDPSTDPKLQQALAEESAKPLRKVKLKTKQAQTDGSQHKRIKQKVNKISCMTATYRNTAKEQQRRFRRTLTKYNTKEQTMQENAETIDTELKTTRTAVQKVKREIVCMHNYMANIRQKIQSYDVDNQQLLNSLHNLHNELCATDKSTLG